jgi:hypothetical protein
MNNINGGKVVRVNN